MKTFKAIINWYIESHSYTGQVIVRGFDQYGKPKKEELTITRRNWLANFLLRFTEKRIRIVSIEL